MAHTNVYRSDAELARTSAPRCALCGHQRPIADEPAEWKITTMRTIQILSPGLRHYIVTTKRLVEGESAFICYECFAESED